MLLKHMMKGKGILEKTTFKSWQKSQLIHKFVDTNFFISLKFYLIIITNIDFGEMPRHLLAFYRPFTTKQSEQTNFSSKSTHSRNN